MQKYTVCSINTNIAYNLLWFLFQAVLNKWINNISIALLWSFHWKLLQISNFERRRTGTLVNILQRLLNNNYFPLVHSIHESEFMQVKLLVNSVYDYWCSVKSRLLSWLSYSVVTYECCPGYEKVLGEKGCPAGLNFNFIILPNAFCSILFPIILHLRLFIWIWWIMFLISTSSSFGEYLQHPGGGWSYYY